MTSYIVLTPQKMTTLAQNHVVSVIKRGNRFSGSTWARAREKYRTGQDSQNKVTMVLHFPHVGRSPHPTDLRQNLHGCCRPRHNHVCKVSNWNFQELRFYRGECLIFLLIVAWALQQCSANELPVILLGVALSLIQSRPIRSDNYTVSQNKTPEFWL